MVGESICAWYPEISQELLGFVTVGLDLQPLVVGVSFPTPGLCPPMSVGTRDLEAALRLEERMGHRQGSCQTPSRVAWTPYRRLRARKRRIRAHSQRTKSRGPHQHILRGEKWSTLFFEDVICVDRHEIQNLLLGSTPAEARHRIFRRNVTCLLSGLD